MDTHVFAAGDRFPDSDAVFGVKKSLIAEFECHDAGLAPDGGERDTPFHTVTFDFTLGRSDDR